MAYNKVIVLGTSHYNTIGLVQSLGLEGVYTIAVVVGKSGTLSYSIYAREIHEVANFEEAIDFIASELVETIPSIIIPCGDEAALQIEKNKDKLQSKFLFEHTLGDITLSQAMNKEYQVKVAATCGIDVPISFEITSERDLPSELYFPCIIKPLLSCEGDKHDICIANNKRELIERLKVLLTHTSRVIVQQFIENNDKELNILGCAYSDGTCQIPLNIEKIRTHPKGRGSVSVGLVRPFDECEKSLLPKIEQMIKSIGYVGLFSFEFIVDNNNQAIYFIELNLRNDALNPFIVKNGVNLPYLHYQDLTGQNLKTYSPTNKCKKMICEPIHMASLYQRSISPFAWLGDIFSASGFMLYLKSDKKLFFNMILNKLFRRLI